MHTIKCLNPSTSGRLYKSIPICFIISFGTGILFSSGLIFLKIFPCGWQLLQILMYSLKSSIMPCQKNCSEIFWYVDSRPRWAAKALAIELSPIPLCTSCIIAVLLSTSNTTLRFSLYIKCPLTILTFLHAFLKLDFFPLSFKILLNKFYFSKILRQLLSPRASPFYSSLLSTISFFMNSE